MDCSQKVETEKQITSHQVSTTCSEISSWSQWSVDGGMGNRAWRWTENGKLSETVSQVLDVLDIT